MKQFLVKLYFGIYSLVSPKKAGETAFYLFQKTRKLPLKEVEEEFYRSVKSIEVGHPRENIHVYECGPTEGKLALLVHGWESNAGSMGAVARRLAAKGFRVVTIDLPAHGKSQLTHTNLRECTEALRAVVYHYRPKSLSIVSHSFGSAVSALAFSGSRYKIDNYIMLTSPNQLLAFFQLFAKAIGINKAAYAELLRLSASILNSPVSWVSVSDALKRVNYERLVLVHDVNDRILPFSNIEAIHQEVPSILHRIENAGHYRMLRNENVLNIVARELHDPERELEHIHSGELRMVV